MFEELLIPLQLIERLETLKGKTRLQKLVFLVQNEATKKKVPASTFHYEIYYYGPFSSELSNIIEKLQKDKLVDEKIEMTPNGYTRYIYSLTNKGKELLQNARTKGLMSLELLAIIKKTAVDYGERQLSEVVEEAYRRYLE